MIVILIGNNDSVLRDDNAFQHVPVTEYEANMAEIIRLAQEKCSRVLVISPPTLNVDGYRVHRSETLKRVDRSVASTQMYTDACTAISSKMNVPNIQFPHLGASMFSDGLHFSAQGNSELFKLVKCVYS